MIFDEEVAVSSDDNLPCSLLMSSSDSACRALWVLRKSFLSRQWESLRSGEGHSTGNIKAHGICWVMRPSLAHRKTESSFLLSNLKCIETSGKQTQEKLQQKHSPFRLPLHWKNILYQQEAEEDEFCGEWDRKKGATQRTQETIRPECKVKAQGVVVVLVKASVMKSVLKLWAMRVYTTSSKPYSVSGNHIWGGTVSQGHGWLIVWSLDEERGLYDMLPSITFSWVLNSRPIFLFRDAHCLRSLPGRVYLPKKMWLYSKEKFIEYESKTLEHFSVSGWGIF